MPYTLKCTLWSYEPIPDRKRKFQINPHMGLTFWCCSSCWWWQTFQFDPRCGPIRSRLPPDGPAFSDMMTSAGTFYSGYWNRITGRVKSASPLYVCSTFYRVLHVTVSFHPETLAAFRFSITRCSLPQTNFSYHRFIDQAALGLAVLQPHSRLICYKVFWFSSWYLINRGRQRTDYMT